MRRAFIAVRNTPHYRADAFANGFKAIGFEVRAGVTMTPAPGDVLLTWNRYGVSESAARTFEARGLPVLVAENGYLGNELAGDRWYAVSRGHHNGAGCWPAGASDRWDDLRVPLAKWREAGDEIVVLPQRGIGPDGVAMPIDWAMKTVAKLSKMTTRPVRVRPHPGTADAVALESDLAHAWAAVTWGSGAAIKAIVSGVPVFYAMPNWIGASAATPLEWADIEAPMRDDAARLSMLQRMAWAQWRLSEIQSGVAMRALLEL